MRPGNVPHLVTPGVRGLIVRPCVVPGLATALLRLAADQTLCRALGDAVRAAQPPCLSRPSPAWS